MNRTRVQKIPVTIPSQYCQSQDRFVRRWYKIFLPSRFELWSYFSQIFEARTHLDPRVDTTTRGSTNNLNCEIMVYLCANNPFPVFDHCSIKAGGGDDNYNIKITNFTHTLSSFFIAPPDEVQRIGIVAGMEHGGPKSMIYNRFLNEESTR